MSAERTSAELVGAELVGAELVGAARTSRDAGAAEIEKLAHQLGVGANCLGYLTGVTVDDLRALRRQIGDALFEADKHHFARMAALAKAVPAALAARISELVLPPILAARTAELFDPHRAAEMVVRMSERYLANVAAAMDPSRSAHVIAEMPPDRVALVGAELASRGEWVVMGAFVSFVSTSALAAAVGALTGEELLHIGFVLDDTSRLGEISDLLSPAQLDDLLAAAGEQGLWRELDDLLGELEDAQADRLADRFARAEESIREPIARAHRTGDLSATNYARLAGAQPRSMSPSVELNRNELTR